MTQIPFSRRANYTKFRISAHTLAIETGRNTIPVTPVENRLCRNCELHETEDEFHAVLRCTQNKDKRKEALDAIDILCNNFNILSEEDKLIYLFNSEDNIMDIYLSKVLTERFSILYKTQTKEDIRLHILTLVLVDINFTFSAKVWIQL